MVMLLVKLPFLPIEAVLKLGQVIADEADQQYFSPATARRELEQAAREYAAGQLTEGELRAIQQEAVGRLTGRTPPVWADEEPLRVTGAS